MNPDLNNWMQLVFRWGHVIAGVMWIGHLWFFNFVNGPFAGKMDAPTKKLVVPELMPRALFWFRWGAAWTWITGFLLLGIIYYQTKTVLFDQDHIGNPWLWLAVVLIALAIGFVIYNLVLKSVKNVVVASAINLVLFAVVYAVLECVAHFSGRALYIHAGAMFGTMMALNVWMVIWPKQRLIINALKSGTPLAADSPDVKIAGL
ncbi:MAG TPA: urate hydroxylase PuuD, partial [Thermoanaerobaculia bacterium]|nr:urate hydroxylase PuuD [Thermoanaerobaculia bacterium]